jgi:TIGR03009 family protein
MAPAFVTDCRQTAKGNGSFTSPALIGLSPAGLLCYRGGRTIVKKSQEGEPMRTLITALAILTAALWLPLDAQQPPPPPNQQPQPPDPALAQQLNILLGVWENMLNGTETVYVEFNAQRKYNNVNGITRYYKGHAKFMKLAGGLVGALVFLQEVDREKRQPIPNKYELVICTGLDVYFVDPADKKVHHLAIANPKPGQVPDQGPLAFLFGMKKEEAQKRYQMKVTKVDGTYSYMDIEPKFQRDAREFTYARLAIFNKAIRTDTTNIPAFMPRQFYWVEPNKNENTWDINILQHNVPQKVLRTDFQKPPLQQGWKLEKMQAAPPQAAGGGQAGQPPNVVRN